MSTQDEEIEALKRHLDDELKCFRESCQADTRRHYIVALNSLQRTIEDANQSAEQIYKNELARAEMFPRVAERLKRMALASYKRTLETNQSMLDAFIRDCEPGI